MFNLRVFLLTFIFCLIPINVSLSGIDNDERDFEQTVQDLLLNTIAPAFGELRYPLFEQTVKLILADCYKTAQERIANSDKHNKLGQTHHLDNLYENHVKNYAKQNRQAILDKQIPGPISRNAGVAVNALCNQMSGFAL